MKESVIRRVFYGIFLISVIHVTAANPREKITQHHPRNHHGGIHSRHFRPLKDPWLNPADGILINGDTPVYEAVRGSNDTEFKQYGNAIEYIVRERPNLEEANVENINAYLSDSRNDRVPIRSPVERSFPDIVYPEILVVVTHDLYEKFQKNIWEIIPYVLAFWNGVDMRFRSIEKPKYRLNIAGIVLETEKGMLRYTTHYITPFQYHQSTIYDLAQRFWYEEKHKIPLNSYDVVVTMTSNEICRQYDSHGNCLKRIIGYGIPEGVCQDNHYERRTNKVVIVHDNGALGGVYAATHELGHMFGALDDGFDVAKNGEPCYPEGHIRNGFTDTTGRTFKWSQCSLDSMEDLLLRNNATCLYNPPKVSGAYIPRYLPGKLYDADKQCIGIGGIRSCELVHNSICRLLTCEVPNGQCSSVSSPAADGTSCDRRDPSKFCLHGECVSPNEFN